MIVRGNENMLVVLLVIILVITLAIIVYNHYNINDEKIVIDSASKKEANSKATKDEEFEEQDYYERNLEQAESKEKIYVHIAGEVKEPGVYKTNSNDRLYNLVEKAGGITKQADLNQINLVDSLEDGARVIIPSVKQANEETQSSTNNNSDSGKINLNQASKEELITISGIGEVTAERIISYRQENNGFAAKDELKQVSGIGEQTYQKIERQLSH